MVAITSKELNCYIHSALLTNTYLLTLMSDSCCRMTLDIKPSGPTLFIFVSVQCCLVKPEIVMCQIQADILGQDIKNVQYSLYIILHNFLGVLCNSIVTAVKGKKVKCTLVQALRLCTCRTAHRGSRGIALLFLDHGLEGGEGSVAHPGCSLPPEGPGTHCTEGWVGPRAGLHKCGKSRPYQDSVPGLSSP